MAALQILFAYPRTIYFVYDQTVDTMVTITGTNKFDGF